jgi:hypothetical protein
MRLQERLQDVCDSDLLNRMIEAERSEDKALADLNKYFGTGRKRKSQEAKTTYCFWGRMRAVLYAEEDRRGGQAALYQRLGMSTSHQRPPKPPKCCPSCGAKLHRTSDRYVTCVKCPDCRLYARSNPHAFEGNL